MYAYKYNEDKYYAGQQECQIDPLESKKQGHPVYLLPANCTWEEPLEEAIHHAPLFLFQEGLTDIPVVLHSICFRHICMRTFCVTSQYLMIYRIVKAGGCTVVLLP